MKKTMLALCIVSSATLMSSCAVDTADTGGPYSPGYYNTYSIGYAGYVGDGTYGSYTPSYWESRYDYLPKYRNNYWAGGSRYGWGGGRYGGYHGYGRR